MTKKQLDKLKKLKLLNKEILTKLSECYKIMKSVNSDAARIWDRDGRLTRSVSDKFYLSRAIVDIKESDVINKSSKHFSEM